MDVIEDAAPGTFDKVVPYVADFSYRRYGRWGVTWDDIAQELWLYIHGPGKKHIDKWVADDEWFRVVRALFGVAKQYALNEKAALSGYDFNDLAWYSPEKLAELVPLALAANWDGMSTDGDAETGGRGNVDPAEGGNLLAMVMDVRRAVRGMEDLSFDPETEAGMHNLQTLCGRLGGEFPSAPGYRRRK